MFLAEAPLRAGLGDQDGVIVKPHAGNIQGQEKDKGGTHKSWNVAKKAAKHATSNVTVSSTSTCVIRGEYTQGICFKKTLDRKTKSEFLRLGGLYHATGKK